MFKSVFGVVGLFVVIPVFGCAASTASSGPEQDEVANTLGSASLSSHAASGGDTCLGGDLPCPGKCEFQDDGTVDFAKLVPILRHDNPNMHWVCKTTTAGPECCGVGGKTPVPDWEAHDDFVCDGANVFHTYTESERTVRHYNPVEADGLARLRSRDVHLVNLELLSKHDDGSGNQVRFRGDFRRHDDFAVPGDQSTVTETYHGVMIDGQALQGSHRGNVIVEKGMLVIPPDGEPTWSGQFDLDENFDAAVGRLCSHL
jgi:hypothetical protein